MGIGETLDRMTLEELLPYDFQKKMLIPNQLLDQVIPKFFDTPYENLLMFPAVDGIALNTPSASTLIRAPMGILYFENTSTLMRNTEILLHIHTPPYRSTMSMHGKRLIADLQTGTNLSTQVIVRAPDNSQIQFWNQGGIYSVPFSHEKSEYLAALAFFDTIKY